MEKRLGNVSISAAGGTATKGAKTYKLALPSAWIAALGITADDRGVELAFDGTQITLSRRESVEVFTRRQRSRGHRVLLLRYYDGNVLCSRIAADETEQVIVAENEAVSWVKTAFGRNETPTWADYLAFLEERCIPRQRAGLRAYLESVGVVEYDPIEIIKKTSGRMAEDDQWLELEVAP